MKAELDTKQEQFLNYILKRVQDDKVDEAEKLVAGCFRKQLEGKFTREDIGAFIPKMTILLKPNHVDEVHQVLQEFASSFQADHN